VAIGGYSINDYWWLFYDQRAFGFGYAFLKIFKSKPLNN
jgi:hypothetical protein